MAKTKSIFLKMKEIECSTSERKTTPARKREGVGKARMWRGSRERERKQGEGEEARRGRDSKERNRKQGQGEIARRGRDSKERER